MTALHRWNSVRPAEVKRLAGLGLSAVGLMLGFVCLGRAVETALDPDLQTADRQETVTVGVLLGVPASFGAVWMLGVLERDRRLARSRRLQALFYKAIRANGGRINAMQFALLAEIPFGEAQDCLDAWAGPLKANFDIDDAGVVMYCFPMADA